MKRLYKLIATVIGSLALLVLLLLWLMGNLSPEGKIAPGKIEPEEKSAEGARTITITPVSVPTEVEAVGTVTARETAEITSIIMAVITQIKADAGDTVEKGQTLFVLDSRDLEARAKQAREGLASAEAALEQAALDAGRIERLYNKQAATRQEYDRSQSGLKMAHASAEAARGAVREAEVILSYTKVNSPIKGKLIDRLADAGDMAMPGKPLGTVYNPATMRLEVSVGEHLRPEVALGETVRASIDPRGSQFESKVMEVVPASDASSRTFTVRVSIAPAEPAYPGMYGRIWLSIGSSEAILLPPDALEHVGQLDMVTVIERGIARKRSVKIGRTYTEGVEILSGLSPGDVIAAP